MKPPHKHFFSSLKQVEKRLKLDDKDKNNPPQQPQTLTQHQTESSYTSPLYFLNQNTTTSSTLNDNSIEHPPHEFLSNPNTNPQLNNLENKNNLLTQNDVVEDNDTIDTMIQLLKLTEFDEKVTEMMMNMPDVVDEEFYDKIVKVKGVKCKKEVERLNGWIDYLVRSGREPLRLAHLVLAKAAVVAAAAGGDVFEFPVTVDEFLKHDPPSG